MALTERQKNFVDEYLIDYNASAAVLRAGYNCKNKKNCESMGAQLLRNPKVRKYLDLKIAERSRRTGITQDRVLKELAKIAFVNPLDVLNKDGNLRDDINIDDAACIQKIKNKGNEEIEICLNDKLKALELLGKHLGTFTEKIDCSGEIELNFNINYGDDDK